MAALTIVGLDPGKTSFAASVSQVDIKTGTKFKVLMTTMVKNTITDLTGNMTQSSNKFKREIQGIVREYKADIIVAERFMVRGRFNGAAAEHLNIMLGIIATINVEKRFITAAQWKNSFNKLYSLDDFYKEVPLVPHRIDASLIGLYGSHYFTGSRPFECLEGRINKCRTQITRTK